MRSSACSEKCPRGSRGTETGASGAPSWSFVGILAGQLINYPGAGNKKLRLRCLPVPEAGGFTGPTSSAASGPTEKHSSGHFPSTKRTVTQDGLGVPDSGAAFRISGRLWVVVTRAGVNDGGRREDLALGLDARWA
jgi:hypothetical protein